MRPAGAIEAEKALQDGEPVISVNWRSTFVYPLRNHIRNCFMDLCAPENDLTSLNNDVIEDLIIIATSLEDEIFQNSNDSSEYFHRLAEKVFKIKNCLAEQISQQQTPSSTQFVENHENRPLPAQYQVSCEPFTGDKLQDQYSSTIGKPKPLQCHELSSTTH